VAVGNLLVKNRDQELNALTFLPVSLAKEEKQHAHTLRRGMPEVAAPEPHDSGSTAEQKQRTIYEYARRLSSPCLCILHEARVRGLTGDCIDAMITRGN
jgi:hypothetical protein